MKILFIIDSIRRGGRERRMIELLKSFREHPDIQVEMVVFSDIIEYQEVYDLPYPLHLLKRQPKRDPRIFYKLFELARQIKPDLVHSWGTMSSIFAIPTCKILGLPLINGNIADAPQDLNFADSRYLRAKLTFPFSDIVLGNSEAGLRAYDAPPSKRLCIYNGFDLSRFQQPEDPDKVKSRLQISKGLVVGMVGAFYDRKDYQTFIKAAILLAQKYDGTQFLAIGDGPNLEKNRALVPIALRNRILIPGQINSIESVINVFDIGVLATNSQVHGEGISNAILEYMALGKPTVATDGGGTPEIVQDGETGFLVPGGDPQVLADKVAILVEDSSLRDRMGHSGRERVMRDFTIHRMKEQYLALYHTFLQADPVPDL